MKQKLIICAALVSAASNIYAATHNSTDGEAPLHRRDSFRALEKIRAQNSSSEVKYYKVVGPNGIAEFRPYVNMMDITEAGQSTQRLISEINNGTRTMPTPNATASKQDPIIDALEDLQRALGDTRRFPDERGAIYVRRHNNAITSYVEETMPLSVDTNSPESIERAIRELSQKAALFRKKVASLEEENRKVTDALKRNLSPTEFDSIQGRLLTTGISSAIEETIRLIKQKHTTQ